MTHQWLRNLYLRSYELRNIDVFLLPLALAIEVDGLFGGSRRNKKVGTQRVHIFNTYAQESITQE